ncbi:hypothetical protein [uncultured Enterococcus sp.]|uniref:hypothetical protein n=1 Tax=uncultured Enterococcus sp. TaxID=167972 RepID=UPI002AA78D28|nr:hypothetical protein [uncultured Enterococcus sp.]
MNDQAFQQKLNENLALQIGQLTMQLAQYQTKIELQEYENKALKDELEKLQNKK